MPSDFLFPKLDAPGLKARPSKANPERLYWVARTDIVKTGYRPETARIQHDIRDPNAHRLIEAMCKRLQAEMLAWKAGIGRERKLCDGTVGGLVRAYQVDRASPYHEPKWNTRRTYDELLDKVVKAIGGRVLAAIGMSDLRRWYDAAKRPKVEAGAERVDRAHKFINIIRRLCGYGVAAEIPECGRLAGILDEMRFKQAERRRVKLELDHAEAFADKAIEMGRLSLAIGTIVQFETGMRQRDVIGEWRPLAKDEPRTGIVLNKLRWQRGLTWADLSRDLIIQKATTKTGAIVSHDLKLLPAVMKLLEMVAPEKRVGPLIIDEDAGRPYANHAYAREWRLVARAAGIPDHVWNSDSRAGAITEAEDAGAELDLIRGAVGHTQLSTTARYSRGAIGKSRKIAELRQAHRATKNMSET